MNYRIFIFCLVFVTMLGFTNVKAECGYDKQYELSQIASNVKANYIVSPEPELYFTINIMNITRDIYIEVINSNTGNSVNYYFFNHSDGMITFNNYDIYNKTNYVISIKSLDSECNKGTLRAISITTPRYNPYYNTKLCKENRNHSLCSKWFDFEVSYDDIKKKIESQKKPVVKEEELVQKLKWYENIYCFFCEHYIFITICFVLIVVIILLLKKRRGIHSEK